MGAEASTRNTEPWTADRPRRNSWIPSRNSCDATEGPVGL